MTTPKKSPTKAAELRSLRSHLQAHSVLFYGPNAAAKYAGGPDLVIPGKPSIAVWMGRQDARDCEPLSVNQSNQFVTLQAFGWRVCNPYGAESALDALQRMGVIKSGV